MDQPELQILRIHDLDLAVWEWAGDEPTLLFAHATGFHGRCWDAIARMFPQHRRVAVDFRGHGLSSKPAPPYIWSAFGRDLAEIAGRLSLRGTVGIGHSMGGHSVLSAAILRPDVFAGLVLVDPTIFPPEYYRMGSLDASFIRRRKNLWTSPDEMFDRFRGRAPFSGWRPEILRDYCRFALVDTENGLVLACPPEVEASIYEHSTTPDADLYPHLAGVHQPIAILRAGTVAKHGMLDASASPTAPGLASHFPNAWDVYLPDRNHFIPMEWPEGVAEEIRRVVSQVTSNAARARP